MPLPLLTTTIGSFPKPAYVRAPTWFDSATVGGAGSTAAHSGYLESRTEADAAAVDRATREVVRAQVGAGIDVPTDGEVRRENYLHYHCRHLDGIDFTNLTRRAMRDGAWVVEVPTIVAPVSARDRFLVDDYKVAQQATSRPVKITVPGPLSLLDSLANEHYADERQLAADLAAALNEEILALAAAGCTWVQVDEPIFARRPETALAYGIEALERCFHGAPAAVTRAMHMCCGYPDRLDNEDYPKADPRAYFDLAPVTVHESRGGEVTIRWDMQARPDESAWVRLDTVDADGLMLAITNPIFFGPRPEPDRFYFGDFVDTGKLING